MNLGWSIMEKNGFKFHQILSAPAQVFGYSQNHVRRSDVLVHGAGDFVANHLRQDHGDWLPKHDSLSLDPAYAPPKNPQAVDHCGMRIRPNHRVWGDQVWSHTQK